MQVWFPGQAFGEALTDCVLGVAEPGGRLPVSIPRQEADSPVLHAKPKGHTLTYAEGLLVGYRGYDRDEREPLFCFGHGLGYTEWSYDSLSLESDTVHAHEDLAVVVTLRNTGSRGGREIVQVYLEPQDDEPDRPLRTLAAFVTVDADAGESVTARLVIPSRAFARFDPDVRDWTWRPVTYTVRAGRSSRDLRVSQPVHLGVRVI
jgi:beta-glucosidase